MNTNTNTNTKTKKPYKNYGRVLVNGTHIGAFTVIKNGWGEDTLVNANTGEYIVNPSIMFNTETNQVIRVGKGTFVKPYFVKTVESRLNGDEEHLEELNDISFIAFDECAKLSIDDIATIMNASVADQGMELLKALASIDENTVESELNRLYDMKY